MQSQGKVIVDAMNLMGYDAMALGGADLQLGEDVLRRLIADARFAVLSANVIVQSTGELFTAPYTLLKIGGRKVGIIGLTDGGISSLSDKPKPIQESSPEPAPSPLSGPPSPTPLQTNEQVIGSLGIIDPAVALAAYVEELETQANIIIVLSNLGWDSNVQLAEMVPGIDLIVSAGAGHVVTDPWQAPHTGTLVCQVGIYPQAHPGQLVANVKMHIDSAGLITEYSGGFAALGPEFADDAEIQQLLASYKEQ